MSDEASKAKRAVLEARPSAKSFRWPSGNWEVFDSLKTLGVAFTEDDAWIYAAANIAGVES